MNFREACQDARVSLEEKGRAVSLTVSIQQGKSTAWEAYSKAWPEAISGEQVRRESIRWSDIQWPA